MREPLEILLDFPVEISSGLVYDRLTLKLNAKRGPDFRTSAANLFGVVPEVIDQISESDLRYIASSLNAYFGN
jgi:hypothetical protein